MERKNAWTEYTQAEREALEQFSGGYRTFLDRAKTERECVSACVEEAERKGFSDLASWSPGTGLQAGDRIYVNWRQKALLVLVLGRRPLSEGLNILGAHIDSPRIDAKQDPLYEDSGLAYLDTHYYGFVKKYQWVAQPLALHGVVVRKDGQVLTLALGEAEGDPVFCITDLLPHLGDEQMKKEAEKVIAGEDLDLLLGSQPLEGEERKAVKARILQILRGMGMEEEDFLSAELEIVPAGRARDLGLDRSMILAYGHDDRVCAYPSLRAVEDIEGIPERTACAVLVDKEEIGSVGATGMNSWLLDNVLSEVCALRGEEGNLAVRRALRRSFMLSSDVSAGYDPLYASVFDKKNAAFLGGGLCFNKYLGSHGKGGSNDASPEFLAQIRRIMDEAKVTWQSAEMGKVDAGGGGTIAVHCAKYGMNVVDAGVPVLSMHAPYEVVSKADLYEAYRGYCAFLQKAGL